MRPDVETDLSDSAHDFTRVVWPAIRHHMGGGDLILATQDRAGRLLDDKAGIDAWQDGPGLGIQGIGFRVQYVPQGQRPFYTFTIRYSRAGEVPTEWQKREFALAHQGQGYVYPHFTVYAYVAAPRRQGALMATGVIPTSLLWDYVKNEARFGSKEDRRKETTDCWFEDNSDGRGTVFICVKWSSLKDYAWIVGPNQPVMMP